MGLPRQQYSADTQRLADVVSRELDRLSAMPLRVGNPTPMLYETYAAKYEDFCRVDAVGLKITLPKIAPTDIGRPITIATLSGKNAAVYPAPGDTIEGASSYSVGSSATRVLAPITGTRWQGVGGV